MAKATSKGEALRNRVLLHLVERYRRDPGVFIKEDEIAEALGVLVGEIRPAMDILESLEYTTPANTQQGRRARISPKGQLAAEALEPVSREGAGAGRRGSPSEFETALAVYTVEGILGEGGAARVYAAHAGDGTPVAIKMLTGDRGSRSQRSRFKNELTFLKANSHPNIVPVTDHGVSEGRPFYVMPRFDGSLRDTLEAGVEPDRALRLFSQILDGVEAAHVKGVVHRDLKPENVLVLRRTGTESVAVADFGIAQFTADYLVTLVETRPADRLANFQYAAPEQRRRGGVVGVPADLFPLGLMLNELFTGEVPHGTDFKTITQVAPAYGYLDPLVAELRRQEPQSRPDSVLAIKRQIELYARDAVIEQKISVLTKEVVPETTVDDALALAPPVIVAVDWQNDVLTLVLDRAVSRGWVQAFKEMGGVGALMGYEPATFDFQANTARIGGVRENIAQEILNYFKGWLPRATEYFRKQLEEKAKREREQRLQQLEEARIAEERRRRVLQKLKV